MATLVSIEDQRAVGPFVPGFVSGVDRVGVMGVEVDKMVWGEGGGVLVISRLRTIFRKAHSRTALTAQTLPNASVNIPTPLFNRGKENIQNPQPKNHHNTNLLPPR